MSYEPLECKQFPRQVLSAEQIKNVYMVLHGSDDKATMVGPLSVAPLIAATKDSDDDPVED